MTQPRVLMVIAFNQFRDEELLEPKAWLEKQGCHATVASTQAGTAQGMMGNTFEVTQTLEAQTATDYDALVIVGGMGSPTELWNNTTLHTLVKSFDAQNKVLSAICLSGAVLALAGVMQGKKATVWDMPESREVYAQAHVTYVAQPVVIDGRYITANGPEAATAFAQAIGQALNLLTTPSV